MMVNCFYVASFVSKVHISDSNKCWNNVRRKGKRSSLNCLLSKLTLQRTKIAQNLQLKNPRRQKTWQSEALASLSGNHEPQAILSLSSTSYPHDNCHRDVHSCLCNTRVQHHADFSVCVRAQTSIKKGEEVGLLASEEEKTKLTLVRRDLIIIFS